MRIKYALFSFLDAKYKLFFNLSCVFFLSSILYWEGKFLDFICWRSISFQCHFIYLLCGLRDICFALLHFAGMGHFEYSNSITQIALWENCGNCISLLEYTVLTAVFFCVLIISHCSRGYIVFSLTPRYCISLTSLPIFFWIYKIEQFLCCGSCIFKFHSICTWLCDAIAMSVYR